MPALTEQDGGPYTSILQRASSFKSKKVEIYIFGKTNIKLLKMLNVYGFKITQIKSIGPRLYSIFFPKKSFILKLRNAETIYIEQYFGLPIIIALLFSKRSTVLVCIPHGSIGKPELLFQKIKSFFFKFVLVSLEKTFKKQLEFRVLSEQEKHYIESSFPSKKVSVLPFVLYFNTVKEIKILEPQRFVYLGRIVPGKGLENLILLVKRLQLLGRDVHVDIFGEGNSVYKKKLEKLIQNNLLEAHFQFFPWIEKKKLNSILQSYCGMIFLSEYESLGLVVLDAMKNSVPIFTTKFVGASQFVHKYQIGFVSRGEQDIVYDFLEFTSNISIYRQNYKKLSLLGFVELIPIAKSLQNDMKHVY